MTRLEIEQRIRLVQLKLSEERHPSTLAMLNRCLDRLIMMDPDDEPEKVARFSKPGSSMNWVGESATDQFGKLVDY